MKKPSTLLISFLLTSFMFAQSLQHPHIWVSEADRSEILNNIEKYNWAKSMYDQLIERNKNTITAHKNNPKTFLSTLSTIPGNRTHHREHLNTGVECAILYYLTKNEDYAQLSADILHYYIKIISKKNPATLKFFDTGSSSDHHIMTREDHPRIGVMYDFIHSFITKTEVTIYDRETQTRVTFDFNAAQKAFEVLVENVLTMGAMNSNHPILELTGGLYPTLCIEDDTRRKSYYDRLWKGERGQNGLNWIFEHFSQDEGIWPESVSYSKGVHNIMLIAANVLDRYDPTNQTIEKNKHLINGAFYFENYKYPNNKTISFGDGERNYYDTDHIIRSVLAICHRKGMVSYKKEAISLLKYIYEAKGGYQPKIITDRLEWRNPLELLWGVDVEQSSEIAKTPSYTTATVKYAGLVIQRNFVNTNNKDYGLMYYTGGATYVHAHATGIDMEIYGAGHVIGPDYGDGTYGSDIHETYAVSHAAHNTVIANGTTKRGMSNSGTWNNIVDTIVLESAEPKKYENPISENFCYSIQYLDDDINACDQQRSNGIIRTSQTSGYYFDIFRSKSRVNNSFHDYIFHGLGDDMIINSNGKPLSLLNTPLRYNNNNIGDERKQPGWQWFEETKTSAPYSGQVITSFHLNKTAKHLHVAVPGGISREYSSALAPPTQYVTSGYDKIKTKVFTMRKYGEAWDSPFVAVYEPSNSVTGTVKAVENLVFNDKTVGLKVINEINGNIVIDYIISPSEKKTIELTNHKITFNGRFAIVRRTKLKSSNNETINLYIGEGESLKYKDILIKTNDTKKATSTYQMEDTSISDVL